MSLLARKNVLHAGVVYEPGQPLPTEPVLWNGRERPLRDDLVELGLACDPASCKCAAEDCCGRRAAAKSVASRTAKTKAKAAA